MCAVHILLLCTFVSFVVDEVQMGTTKETKVRKGAPFKIDAQSEFH
jgi:hypothetical protein